MIERTTDLEWMRGILREMGSGRMEEDVLRDEVGDSRNWFVRTKSEVVEGFFWFRPTGPGKWEGHACVGKKNWGWKWVGLSRAVMRWFFNASKATEVSTFCPQNMPESAAYARLCGMRRMGAGQMAGVEWKFHGDAEKRYQRRNK
jgi:hypothetical protein